MSSRISIKNDIGYSIPVPLFNKIKDAILGKDYSLSIFVGEPEEVRKLNLMYRDINKPTDILSFPLTEKEGEIILCPSEISKKAPKFDRSKENFLLFLFIHGCVHLKGYDHGCRMESIEAGVREQFGI